MTLRLLYAAVSGDFERQIRAIQAPIAKAATETVREAAAIVKRDAKSELSGAGFSARTSNAMRAVVTPKSGDSINAAADFFLRPAYLNVFEKGATIAGKPLLWLPLDTVPFGVGGKRLTPAQYVQRIGPLHSARGAGRPLLVGKGSRGSILRATSKVVRFRKGALGRGQSQGQDNVPLFIGVPSVTLSKKLNLTEIVRRTAARIGEIYLKHIKAA